MKISKSDTWSTSLTPTPRPRKVVSPEVALAIRQDRDLRIEEDPYDENLLYLSEKSGHPAFYEMLKGRIRCKRLELAKYPDAFRRSLPPAGALPPVAPGRAPLLVLANRQVLSLPVGKNGTSLNTILTGRTGGGKTTLLVLLLVFFAGLAISIVFDRKGGLDRLGGFDLPGGVVVLDAERDVKLSLAEGLSFLTAEYHLSQMVDLLASYGGFFTSRRLLLGILHHLLRTQGPAGLTISNALHELDKIGAAATSRTGGFKETLHYALAGLLDRTGRTFDYADSNFLQRLFSQPKTFVIRTGGLTSHDATLMAIMIYRYVYEYRRIRNVSAPPVLIVLDDAMPFTTGSKGSESEGHTSPIAEWATLGRALNIGLIIGAQNFSLISPTLRNNCDTLISLGSYGEDASAVAKFMGLDAEQAAVLPLIRPGEAIALARSQWPLALRGAVPEVV